MSAVRSRWALVGAVVVAALVCAPACGGKAAGPHAPPGPVLEVTALDASAARSGADAGGGPLRARLIATIGRKATGPMVAKSGDAALAAWIVTPEHGPGQILVVVPMAADGAPLGEAKAIAEVPQEATSLVVRPAGGSRGGWVVAWSALLDRGESLTSLGVGPDGAARGTPSDVERTNDHVVWSDLVPTARGSVCVWAEQTANGDANLLSASLDSDGKPRATPVRVARGVSGWQAVAASGGVGLALVGRTAGARGGVASWMRLDPDGRPLGATVPVTTTPTVSDEIDVAPFAGGWLLGWTDRTGEDAQVVLASVDESGKLQPPRRAMDSIGGSSLVGLAAGAAGVVLAWDEPHARTRATRALHLATVATEGPLSAQPVASIQMAGLGMPEIVATEHGFAMLVSAPTCASDGACTGTPAPTFVRFDTRFAPAQAEPIVVGDSRAAASLGWGLRCAGDRCLALAASNETPTPVFSVDLSPRTSPFLAPMVPPPPADAPRASGLVTLATGPFADLAATRIGDATFVVTSTSAVDDPHDHKRRGASTLALRVFGADGQPVGAPSNVSTRALPVGGIALTAGGRPEDGAAVAWVARDDGDPQVHVAHLDAHGKRVNEVQLTTSRGDASDVAAAWAGDGWLVAWVDARDGNGEVYATKVDRDLNRVAREERITNAPGDAGDVALLVHGGAAFVAWSDPRESPREGVADIYATTLRLKDAKRAGDEVRVLATAAHSRSPKLAATSDGAAVAWIEDAPANLDAAGSAMVARLDASAHVVGAPVALTLSTPASATSLALDAAADGIRAVVAHATSNDVVLDALVLSKDGVPAGRSWPLVELDAPGSFEVALAFAGDAVFFDDTTAPGGDHRLRRVSVVWRR
jgi:hypothetical protein